MDGGITERYEAVAAAAVPAGDSSDLSPSSEDDMPELELRGLRDPSEVDSDRSSPNISIDWQSFHNLQQEVHRVLNKEYRTGIHKAESNPTSPRHHAPPREHPLEQSFEDYHDPEIHEFGKSWDESCEEVENSISSISLSPSSSSARDTPTSINCGDGVGATPVAVEVTGPERDIIRKRMDSFWDSLRNREPKLKSGDELVAAWTQSIEEIQQELSAAQVHQISEAIEETQPPKTDETDEKNAFIDEPDSEDQASLNSRASIESMDDPGFTLHRSAGQLDVRHPEPEPQSHLIFAPASDGRGDQYIGAEICEIYINPVASQKQYNPWADILDDLRGTQETEPKPTPKIANPESESSGNDRDSDGDSQYSEVFELKSKFSHSRDGDQETGSGTSEEEEDIAPLVMEVEDYVLPEQQQGARPRRMLSLTSVWDRVQGFMRSASGIKPCCSTREGAVLHSKSVNLGRNELLNTDTEAEEEGYGVWSVRHCN